MSQPGFLWQPYKNKISFFCLSAGNPCWEAGLIPMARLLVSHSIWHQFASAICLPTTTAVSSSSDLAAQASPSPLKQLL